MQSCSLVSESSGVLVTRWYSAERKFQSNRALCATNTRPTMCCASSPAISPNGGAFLTIASSIPVRCVMNGGIGRPGFTSDENASRTTPPFTNIAATSVTRSPAHALIPVVSTSTTRKETSANGVPDAEGV